MVSPIFVVGARRTGTTWLGNIICNHSDVAGIQQASKVRQEGIYESVFFSHLAGKYGDLKDPNNLIQFVEIFANSSYFIQSGLDKEIFYRDPPGTYQDFFKLLLERVARKQGAAYFIEKTPAHALHLEELSRYYNNAKFVAIRRNIIDQIRSASKLNEFSVGKNAGRVKKRLLLLKRIITYHAYNKHIMHFMASAPDKILLIEYEDLKRATEETVIRVCDFLGIGFQPEMLQQRHKPNTSFTDSSERKQVLSIAEEELIKRLNPFFELLPYALYRWLRIVERRVEGRRLPHWFYLIKLEEHGWTVDYWESQKKA